MYIVTHSDSDNNGMYKIDVDVEPKEEWVISFYLGMSRIHLTAKEEKAFREKYLRCVGVLEDYYHRIV